MWNPRPPPSVPSPVPWVSDAAWADLRDLVRFLPPEPRPCFPDPDAKLVTEADRRRAATLPVLPGAPLPPPGDLDTLAAALAQTEGPGFVVRNQVWPICCSRLTTLVQLTAADARRAGPALALGYLEEELRRGHGPPALVARMLATGFAAEVEAIRAERTVEGVHPFHCRACGHVYLASYQP